MEAWRPTDPWGKQVVDAVNKILGEIGPSEALSKLSQGSTESEAPEDAEAITRRLEGVAQEEADRKAYRRLKGTENAKRRIAEENGVGQPHCWATMDLTDAWDAASVVTQTDIGYSTETPTEPPIGLFYSGKINGVHAESEAGKSWLGCLVAVQELARGHHVAYVDFEDDENAIVQRLRLLGASREAVLTHFHYRRPATPLTEADLAEFRALVDLKGTLAVFDGMTEAMALEGLDFNDGGNVATWHAKLTKPFALAGWGVVVLDHMPLGVQRAIGSQHKKSAITGVSYLLQSVAPLGAGVRGKSRLKVEKDRGAWVRRHAAPGRTPQWFADMVIDFEGKAMPTANVWLAAPRAAEEEPGYDTAPPEKLREAVMGFVAGNPGCSITAVRSGVKGANDKIDWAREWLAEAGQIKIDEIGQRKAHYAVATDDQPSPDPAETLP